MDKIAIIGVPSSAGARHAGQEDVPALFRSKGMVEQLRTSGIDEFPVADVPHPKGLGFLETMDAKRVFVEDSKFAGLVITEFNTGRDPDGRNAEQLVNSLSRIFRNAGHN